MGAFGRKWEKVLDTLQYPLWWGLDLGDVSQSGDEEHVVNLGVPIEPQRHAAPEFEALTKLLVWALPGARTLARANVEAEVLAVVPNRHIFPSWRGLVPSYVESFGPKGVEGDDDRLGEIELQSRDLGKLVEKFR